MCFFARPFDVDEPDLAPPAAQQGVELRALESKGTVGVAGAAGVAGVAPPVDAKSTTLAPESKGVAEEQVLATTSCCDVEATALAPKSTEGTASEAAGAPLPTRVAQGTVASGDAGGWEKIVWRVSSPEDAPEKACGSKKADETGDMAGDESSLELPLERT